MARLAQQGTVFEPMRPLPPITTIFMVHNFKSRDANSRICCGAIFCWLRFGPPD